MRAKNTSNEQAYSSQTTEDNQLGVHVLLNSMATLPPNTTLLDAPEWNYSLTQKSRVRAHHANLEPLRNTPYPPNIS